MATTRWLCTVCGYVHEGETPPQFCPVCGATADLFEPYAAAPAAAAETLPACWRCLNCDYLHEGEAPPPVCPVCGVGADQFEPCRERAALAVTRATTGQIVIAGAGIAGVSAAAAARQSAPDARITLLTREHDLPYYRLNLTRYLAGEIAAEMLPIHPESWYVGQRITLLRGVELRVIDRAAKQLQLEGHPDLPYDRLILALGAHPFVPALPGVNRGNVIALRSRRDAEEILARSLPGRRAVVIGGGLLGLETAAALVRRNVATTVVEGFGWLLPRQLNRPAGEVLAQQVERLGIQLVLQAQVKALDGDEQVRGVALASGEILPADLVVIAAGVRSNSYIARLARLAVNDGVIVDNALRSSDPDIFAVGDLSEHQGVSYGTWAPAQYQGTIAGMNAAGGALTFAGIPRSHLLKVLGTDLFSIGQVQPEDGSYLALEERTGEHYFLFLFRDTHLVGAILLGDASLAPAVKQMIEQKSSCAELLARAPTAQALRQALAG